MGDTIRVPHFFIYQESTFLINKTLREDAHCGVQGVCRKRPPQAPECAKAHSYQKSTFLFYYNRLYGIDCLLE